MPDDNGSPVVSPHGIKPVGVVARLKCGFETRAESVEITTCDGKIVLDGPQWEEVLAVLGGKRYSLAITEQGGYSCSAMLLSNEDFDWQQANGGPKGACMRLFSKGENKA